jgi:hypothetical protein
MMFLNLRLVIGTDPDKLFAIKSAIDNDIPCLFIQGTGVLGDFSSCLLDFFKRKKKSTEDEKIIKESIRTCVQDKWGLKFNNSDEEVNSFEKYTNCIWDIIKSNNLDLFIYEYSFKDTTDYNLDFAIFKAIINFNKEYKKVGLFKLIEMTIDWNRCDVAKKEIFNHNIEWVSINHLN